MSSSKALFLIVTVVIVSTCTTDGVAEARGRLFDRFRVQQTAPYAPTPSPAPGLLGGKILDFLRNITKPGALKDFRTNITGEYYGVLYARLSGDVASSYSKTAADASAGGFFAMVLTRKPYFSDNASSGDNSTNKVFDFNVRVVTNVAFKDAGEPTDVAFLDPSADNSNTSANSPLLDVGPMQWGNGTGLYDSFRDGILGSFPFLDFILPNLYRYNTRKSWRRVRDMPGTAGLTYGDLIDRVIANPDGVAVRLATPSYPWGAVAGTFKFKKAPNT